MPGGGKGKPQQSAEHGGSVRDEGQVRRGEMGDSLMEKRSQQENVCFSFLKRQIYYLMVLEVRAQKGSPKAKIEAWAGRVPVEGWGRICLRSLPGFRRPEGSRPLPLSSSRRCELLPTWPSL